MHRRGEHHARPVVARKDQRPLEGTRRQHHTLGPHAPQPRVCARPCRQPLCEDHFVVVEIADGCRAGEHPCVGATRQQCGTPVHPVPARATVDFRILPAQRAAEQRLLLGEDDAGPARGRGDRRCEPRRPAAHDEHVAMGMQRVVALGVRCPRRTPEPRRVADERLEQMPGRPHECLVVKARRQESREHPVDRAHVEIGAGPAIDRMRREPIGQFDLGGAQVELGPRTRGHRDERIGLLDASREQAPRTVILERPPDHGHAAGEERRGQGIAGKPAILPPAKAEAEGLAVVHVAAAVDPSAAHGTISGGLSPIR